MLLLLLLFLLQELGARFSWRVSVGCRRRRESRARRLGPERARQLESGACNSLHSSPCRVGLAAAERRRREEQLAGGERLAVRSRKRALRRRGRSGECWRRRGLLGGVRGAAAGDGAAAGLLAQRGPAAREPREEPLQEHSPLCAFRTYCYCLLSFSCIYSYNTVRSELRYDISLRFESTRVDSTLECSCMSAAVEESCVLSPIWTAIVARVLSARECPRIKVEPAIRSDSRAPSARCTLSNENSIFSFVSITLLVRVLSNYEHKPDYMYKSSRQRSHVFTFCSARHCKVL